MDTILLIPEPVELALHTRPPEHDFRSAEHSPAEDAAFRRALHRHTPFETVLFEAIGTKLADGARH